MNRWELAGLSAGMLVLVGLALGVPCSPLHWSAWWPHRMARFGARLRAWLR